MKQFLVWLLAFFTTVLFPGYSPLPTQSAALQRDLAALSKRGFTYRMLDNDLIELTDPLSGTKHLKSLREPSEAAIRAWAAQRGIPILEIDPNTVDTSRYTGWYRYWSRVPLSNTNAEPLLVGNADRNGKTEVYGIYRDSGAPTSTQIYQVDSIGTVSFLHDFTPRIGLAQRLIDSDTDTLTEFVLSHGGSFFFYEQDSSISLPITFQFEHRGIQSSVDPGYTHIYFGNLDNDSLLDFLYKGSERDSVDTTIAYGKVYVGEYDNQIANFERVWSREYIGGGEGGLGGFAVDDFDGDGKKEFATVDLISGRIFVTENTANNNYELIWQDSVPFVNVSEVGSGDVDLDGKPEFFVAATMFDGNWTTVFESDSNDYYSPKFLFHLLSGGTFDVPRFATTDVDGDRKVELIVCSGRDIYMFKSSQDNQYYLWYLKRENARDGIQFFDFNKDDRKDFVVSKTVYVNPPGYFRSYADVYVATSLVSVNEADGGLRAKGIGLYPNFPNPFNPSTTIEFAVPSRVCASLTIYDVRGKKVEVLMNKTIDAGRYSVKWDGIGRSSGIYFYRLQAGSNTVTRKLLLLH